MLLLSHEDPDVPWGCKVASLITLLDAAIAVGRGNVFILDM